MTPRITEDCMGTEDNEERSQAIARLRNGVAINEAKRPEQDEKCSQQTDDRDGIVYKERCP